MTDNQPHDRNTHRSLTTSRRRILETGTAALGGSLLTSGLASDDGVVTAATSSDYQQVRDRWQEMILGNAPNTSDPYVDAIVTNVNDDAQTYQNAHTRSASDRVFTDLDLDGSNGDKNRLLTYRRLFAMARAYLTEGGTFYNDSTVIDDVTWGLDYMDSNDWFSDGSPEPGRWWFYGHGIPQVLSRTVLLLYDQLNATERSAYMAAVKDHNVLASGRSGDKAKNALTNIAYGAVMEDNARLTDGAENCAPLIAYTDDPPGDGFYRDGTFINHDAFVYNNGGYGRMVLRNLPRVIYIVDGTPWSQTAAAWFADFPDIVFDSYLSTLYDGGTVSTFRGRDISRASSTSFTNAAEYLPAIARLASVLSTPTADQLRARVKHHLQANTFVELRDVAAERRKNYVHDVQLLNDVLADGELTATEETGRRVFHNGDRIIAKTDAYGAEVGMYSTRIANYESINDENKHGWHHGRGMTLLHTDDRSQFVEDFWPTVDPYRIPGTTVVSTSLSDSAYADTQSNADWVGGSTIDTVAAVGMQMDPNYADITGKKSWLMFDDEIVCLGADITSSAADPVETTVINRKLNGAGDNAFVVDGTNQPTNLGWSSAYSNPSWAWLDGTGGYYFPSNQSFDVKREQRSGSWEDINLQNNKGGMTFTRNYLTLWRDHGTGPSGGTYEYVLLPDRTESETQSYAANPAVTVLSNDATVQAAETVDLFAANFWSSGSVAGVTADGPASVSIDETDDGFTVAISDPTQTQSTLGIDIDREAAGSVVSSAPEVTVDQTVPSVQLTVDVSSTHGDSLAVEFSNSASSGPIGHWALDDGTGSTAVDSAGNNDGTLLGNPSWTNGYLNGALDHDGSGDAVDIGNPGVLQQQPPFTVTAWFNADSWSSSTHDRLIDHGAYSGAGYEGFAVLSDIDDEAIIGRIGDGNGNFYNTVSTTVPSTDSWHHVAYVVADGSQTLYLDGSPIATSSHSISIGYGSESLYLGGQTGGAQYFDGALDDVRLYDRDLSQSEVQDLASAPGSGPIARWALDDGSGSTATDSSGSNDGTLLGNPSWTNGKVSGALDLDGAGDAVDIGNPGALQQQPPFTVTAWFNADSWSSSTHDRLVDHGAYSSAGYEGFAVLSDGDSDALIGRIGDGNGTYYDTVSTSTPSTGSWHHVAYVVADGSQTLYLDGSVIATSSHSITIGYGSEPLYLGGQTGDSQYFDGALDDVRMYPGTLTKNEINSLPGF